MKFSIITPTLNQSHFIEDTIQSVLNQKYDDFEHLIIDGGSTDGTINILKKYPHLKWISEKDTGQSNAINKGFRMATGDIIAWINSDDYYDSDIFKLVNEYFSNNSNCNFIYGNITYVNFYRQFIEKYEGENLSYRNLIKCPDIIRQPSCFWKHDVIKKIGYLNEDLHLAMDFDFFLRIGKNFNFQYVPKNISYFRYYSDGKTSKFKKRQLFELIKVLYFHENIKMLKALPYILKKIYYLYSK